MKQEATFALTISKVDEQLFNGDANSVTLPGAKGQLTVLAHHEPFIALLDKGVITVRSENETKFEITRGMCEISNNQVTVLVQE